MSLDPPPAAEIQAFPPAPVPVPVPVPAPVPVASDPRSALERRLTREILMAERLRATLLALVPGIAMLVVLAGSALDPTLLTTIFRGPVDRVPIGLFLGVVATYEFYALYSIERLIRSEKKPPPLRRYVNALIEVSLPSCVIVYYMTIIEPVHALLLPPTFVYFIFILLSTLRLDFGLSVFTGLVAALEYAGLSLAVVGPGTAAEDGTGTLPHHLGKACILLVSGFAAGFVARRLRKSFVNTLESIEDRNRVLNVFGQHVSPAVAEQLLEQKAGVKSEGREVCIMFLDIRDFTAFAEKRSPEEVVGYLNSVFEFMIASVNDHQGIVNKFLGDGFMAIFGAPLGDEDRCRHGIEAGLAILARVEEQVAAGKIPATRVGIGLHAGRAVVGNVGSAMRKEYTVIGDVVNLASRVEALNKQFGSQLLVTEQVRKESGMPDEAFLAKPALTVRGRDEPVQIYELR
ncbi:MAG: adenylate/guanylate cyclase domain-containing protein [Byssovorax sp.]